MTNTKKKTNNGNAVQKTNGAALSLDTIVQDSESFSGLENINSADDLALP